jgi:hypothetical protein
MDYYLADWGSVFVSIHFAEAHSPKLPRIVFVGTLRLSPAATIALSDSGCAGRQPAPRAASA